LVQQQLALPNLDPDEIVNIQFVMQHLERSGDCGIKFADVDVRGNRHTLDAGKAALEHGQTLKNRNFEFVSIQI
jgi:hypothetical protein